MPDHKIVLSADTPCDIGEELKARYAVSLYPLHIILDEKQYTDGYDITSRNYTKPGGSTAFSAYRRHQSRRVPSYFQAFLDQGLDVIHISLGSGISSSHAHALIAAIALKDSGNVYVIDSSSLSTGFGLLVCESGERIKAGLPAKQIVEEVSALTQDTRASFSLDTLEFMRAGGRCSSITQIGAALMNIKPTILVKNDRQGSMVVGKKYMGKLAPSLMKYVDDQAQRSQRSDSGSRVL
jgi:DegV family protein with EDD domain